MERDPTNDVDSYRAPFREWLAARWPFAVNLEIGEISSPATGYSAQTLILPVTFERDAVACEERVVLRVENPGPSIYPQQAPGLDVEVEIQYRTMELLSKVSKAPLAPLIGYEGDSGVLGSPFFAMGFIEGEVPVLEPMYTQAGFFFDASPDDRRRMIENGLRVLADFHKLDWTAAGFDWLVAPGVTPDVQAQVDIWQRFAQHELRDRRHPNLERAFEWLHANAPSGLEPAFSWGDSRPGNILWRNFEPVCVTDFENVAIAPPEVDLGWWLMFDRSCHDAMGTPRLPGEPSLEEQRDFYASCLGRDIGDTLYCELLAAVRYAAIVVRVMNRMEERGQIPSDHTIWLDNPPAQLVAGYLGDLE